MRQTILKTENIDKYFYDPIEFQVLKNISFEVQKGVNFFQWLENRAVVNLRCCMFYQRWIQNTKEIYSLITN